jgi:hypothetical protein
MLNVQYLFDPSLNIAFAANDLREMIQEIAFLHQLPRVCPMCEASVHFFYRSPQGNEYYGLKCTGSPAHEVNFGIHKEGRGLFYKGDDKWELEYNARQAANGGQGGALSGGQPATQPAQTGQTSPTGDKAPVDKLNMIGAVARAKKVQDLDQFCQKVLGDMGLPKHSTADLTASEADIVLEMLKGL